MKKMQLRIPIEIHDLETGKPIDEYRRTICLELESESADDAVAALADYLFGALTEDPEEGEGGRKSKVLS